MITQHFDSIYIVLFLIWVQHSMFLEWGHAKDDTFRFIRKTDQVAQIMPGEQRP